MTETTGQVSFSRPAPGPGPRPWSLLFSKGQPHPVQPPGKVNSFGLRAPGPQCFLSFLWSWSDFPLCPTRNFLSFLSLLAEDWVFLPLMSSDQRLGQIHPGNEWLEGWAHEGSIFHRVGCGSSVRKGLPQVFAPLQMTSRGASQWVLTGLSNPALANLPFEQ